MFLPALASGLTCMAIVWAVFRRRIPDQLDMPPLQPSQLLKRPLAALYGVCCLAGCLLLLAASSYLEVRIWVVTTAFFALMLAKDVFTDYRRYKAAADLRISADDVQLLSISPETSGEAVTSTPHDINESTADTWDNTGSANLTKPEAFSWRTGDTATTMGRMPWKIVPFVVGMFVMVQALVSSGWIAMFAQALASVVGVPVVAVFVMCFLSALVCNLVNNQPMTILFTQILLHRNFQDAVGPLSLKASMYATIMGSNYGANFTLIGALAGIMWSSILDFKGIKIGYLQFAKYGFIVMPAVVASGCLVFALELLVVGS
eukprot:TRINITY_DN2851_c0_g1_i2.p1 TRINITY_DN2851_c0_g1~~TRINITY_DN2851_c0_g1_i2.p1  ORF type:complete len:318 (-),score=110.28 TRINITY_DN2851_c0_g1_i2:135-1088(-)